MMHILQYLVSRFRKDEDGLALTEYLLLLGLLTAAVMLAVFAFGTNLGAQWQGWADWMDTAPIEPPTLPAAGG